MKKRQELTLLLIIVLSVWSLIGCGVSKEEHAKLVSELEKTKAELQKVQATAAEQKKSLLDISKIDPKLDEKLKAAQQKINDLTSKFKSITLQNSDLSSKIKDLSLQNGKLSEQKSKLEAMIAELQNKLKTFEGQTKDLPTGLFKPR